MGAENLSPTRIRTPDRPARSESLYRVRYPGPKDKQEKKSKMERRVNWRIKKRRRWT
jgi:hypothetical protein